MSATTALTWLLTQDEPEARRIAVQQLIKIEGEEVAELYIRALGDSDWRVRKEAAGLAPSLAERPGLIDTIARALEDAENIGLRNAAVEALIGIGRPTLPAILRMMDSLDADGRKLGIEVLSGIADPQAVDAIIHALDDADSNVALTAVDALRNAGDAGEGPRQQAITALMARVDGAGPIVKLAAFGVLSHLNAELPWSIFEALVDDPILGRYVIAAAVHSRDERAVTALADAVGRGENPIFHQAIVAIGDRIVAQPDDTEFAALAKGKLRSFSNAREHLLSLLKEDEDGQVRGSALIVLALMGHLDDIPVLVDALGDEELASRAEHALRIYGNEAVQSALTRPPPGSEGV